MRLLCVKQFIIEYQNVGPDLGQNYLLGLIKRTLKALDKESFLILYKSLIRSILDYGGSVYYPSTKKNIQLIKNIQRQQEYYQN